MKKLFAGMAIIGIFVILGCSNPAGETSVYSIDLSESETYTFPNAAAGYGPQSPRTVEVTNTGNRPTGPLSIAKAGANPDAFTVSPAGLTDVAVDGAGSFTVVPVADLGAGTYTATITVSGGNGISAGFAVSFTVAPQGTPLYSISLSENGPYAFPNAAAGYGPQSPLTVTVNNEGNQPTGTLSIATSGTNSDAFTVSPASLNSIAAGGNGSFTVAPVTNLGAGTYAATITVSGGNNLSANFTVSFTVAPQGTPVYGIRLDESGTYAFPAAVAGYPEQTPRTVTVANTGDQPTGPLTIAITGDTAAFGASPSTIDSIAVEGTGTFTVVPATGLVAGTYTATINITGDNDISGTLTVSFRVYYSYTVTFDPDGGTLLTTSAQSDSNGRVSLPAPPTKYGYVFGGWYEQQNGEGAEFTAETRVNIATTVYAKWTYASTITVTISPATEEINLEKSHEYDLSQEAGNTLQIRAPDGYSNYAWYVDGQYEYSLGRIKTIDPGSYSYGTHSVLLKYEKDGIPYGCEVLFRVVR